MKKELVDGIKAFWGYIMAVAKCQQYIEDTYVVVPLTAKEELQDIHKHSLLVYVWHWSWDCEEAFHEGKRWLSEAPVFVYNDSKLPLHLAGDASNYSVGVVLSHVLPDGTEHSGTLVAPWWHLHQRHWSAVSEAQCAKEALSLIIGIKNSHK